MQHDKLDHAVYSMALALAGAVLFGAPAGVALAALIGLGKEVYDYHHPGHQADARDLAANAVGLVAAWLVLSIGGMVP